jgi:hypothetical protein
MAGTIAADTLTHSTAGSIATNYVVEGSAKAWVNINTNTSTSVLDSFNTASLTDNGTGDTTQTFTNAMNNANFASNGSGVHGSLSNYDSNLTIPHEDTPTTTTVRSQMSNSAAAVSDGPYISHSIHGDLA